LDLIFEFELALDFVFPRLLGISYKVGKLLSEAKTIALDF
jgi:hypothetical protein